MRLSEATIKQLRRRSSGASMLETQRVLRRSLSGASSVHVRSKAASETSDHSHELHNELDDGRPQPHRRRTLLQARRVNMGHAIEHWQDDITSALFEPTAKVSERDYETIVRPLMDAGHAANHQRDKERLLERVKTRSGRLATSTVLVSTALANDTSTHTACQAILHGEELPHGAAEIVPPPMTPTHTTRKISTGTLACGMAQLTPHRPATTRRSALPAAV